MKNQTAKFQISPKHVLSFQLQKQDYKIQLKKSSEEEIINLRMTCQPGFVLRDTNGKLYCAPIPSCHLVPKESFWETHMCRNCAKGCICDKIHDNSLEANINDGHKLGTAVELSKRLEKYPFITIGYQIFNASTNDDFTVCDCKNFTTYRPRKNLTLEEIRKAKQTLYDFLYDDYLR